MQQIILWETSESTPLLQDVIYERKRLHSMLFALIENTLQNSDGNLKTVFALLTTGINYWILQLQQLIPAFLGRHNKAKGKKQIFDTIQAIISRAHEQHE